MSEPVLKVTDLSVRATGSDSQIVRDVSFEVQAGEAVCVVGESGSGKSVTALSVMGLLPKESLRVDGGSIVLGNEEIVGASAARLRAMRATDMAMVFQEPMTALNPVLNVGCQIEEVLAIHTRLNPRERRTRVLEMLREVHLPDVERVYDSYPHQLSGGQRQRIVICMALVMKPKLLIADEPTTALDVTTQKQILALIRELQKKHNTALLFITHDFGVVAELADRIVVMKQGDVVETGTRADILVRPRKEYTCTLVSAVPSLTPRSRSLLPPASSVLSVSGLNKVYSHKRLFGDVRSVSAADNVNFEMRRGEILGVVGESGSGKSTVARCIARLIDPTSGNIRLGDTDIARLPSRELRPMRRRVQIIFQDPYRSLNPRRRIGESLIEGLVNFGTARDAALAKVSQLLNLVGMEADVVARYPHQFSGGQRQRLCIARALALEPALLIADEAVSALDVTVQEQVLRLFEDIRARTGIAMLFITHDLRVAAQICDTIAVMQKGKIVEIGTAAEVLSTPRETYTKALMAAAPGRHWDFQNRMSVEAETA